MARDLRQTGDIVEVVPARRSKSLRSRLARDGFTHELWAGAGGAPRPLQA
jgi:hypothetical protein